MCLDCLTSALFASSSRRHRVESPVCRSLSRTEQVHGQFRANESMHDGSSCSTYRATIMWCWLKRLLKDCSVGDRFKYLREWRLLPFWASIYKRATICTLPLFGFALAYYQTNYGSPTWYVNFSDNKPIENKKNLLSMYILILLCEEN